MTNIGVYAIRNIENGKRYVGSSTRLLVRRRAHFSDLRAGKHHSPKLQHAWQKYGELAFVWEVLELTTADVLIAREQHWIDSMNSVRDGYNAAPLAGTNTGHRHTTEWRENHSRMMRGRVLTQEQRERQIAAIRSAEVRAKISASGKGRDKTPEHLANIVAALATPSVKAKLRTRPGPNAGKTMPETTRELLRNKAQARWADPELRAKFVAARRARG